MANPAQEEHTHVFWVIGRPTYSKKAKNLAVCLVRQRLPGENSLFVVREAEDLVRYHSISGPGHSCFLGWWPKMQMAERGKVGVTELIRWLLEKSNS